MVTKHKRGTDLAPEKRLTHSRYVPGSVLGRGAQGIVLRVHDREATDRPLVAKIFEPGLLSQDLLLGEFALLSRLRIPGLVRAYDLSRDETTGAPFLVEDFVDGPDARQWLQAPSKSGRDDRAPRLKVLMTGIAGTLALLHDAGFVHGDLKPAHVRMESGRPMLLDLGAAVAHASLEPAAKGEHRSAVAWTRAYAAPEIVAGARPSPNSDLYALGALVWAAVTTTPPKPNEKRALRDVAAWVPPSVSDLVSELLSPHPADRPEGARGVLGRLGASQSTTSRGGEDTGGLRPIAAAPIGRARELAALLASTGSVSYVSGKAGLGKSHLLQELVTQRLLFGGDTRLVRFPAEAAFVTALVEFFRGDASQSPFRIQSGRELVLVLDQIERAPEELRSALEAFRCRSDRPSEVRVIAAARNVPDAVPSIRLESLSDDDLDALCRFLGERDADRRNELVRVADGNPGWLLSAFGRVPLGRDTVHANVEALAEHARRLLGAVALLGGEMPLDLVTAWLGTNAPGAIAELASRGLLSRRGKQDGHESTASVLLTAPAQALDLASALATFEVVDELAEVLLGDPRSTAEVLLAVALGPQPPARRTSLLHGAAVRARVARLRSIEADALLALAADPRERKPDVLRSLERLTRGVGNSASHPEVLSWIVEAATREPSLETLALRRRADGLARKGEYDAAAELLHDALVKARLRGDRVEQALAHAAQGAVALYRGDFRGAKHPLLEATALLDRTSFEDAEEIARLDHNVGIVAFYEERMEDAIVAFTQSIECKRALGDRAGVSACLLNLGLALAKASRFDDAVGALDEAVALARSLGKDASTAWCLAARAEVEVRRGDARAAERWIAEAESSTEELPEPVRTDLVLARAEAALLLGDGKAALAYLERLGSAARGDDALADARAFLVEARARLAHVPVDRRCAARLAICAIKIARREGFLEVERQAIAALRTARRSRRSARFDSTAHPPILRKAITMTEDLDGDLWQWLEGVSMGGTRADVASDLARRIVRESGAERVFIVFVGGDGDEVFGVDVDGLPIARPKDRLDRRFVEEALRVSAPLYQPEFESTASRGSRLAVASREPAVGMRRSALVLEHRFASRRFDELDPALIRKWSILAGLAERLGRGAAEASDLDGPETSERESFGTARSVHDDSVLLESSTSLPLSGTRREFPSLVGSSASFKSALARLERSLESDLPVLILGETGVGKEVFAKALHDEGPRRSRPFVAVNCGAIPENLFEAELFGHERGAFTGAERARSGLIAKAEGGTLFLDEIGELPIARQAALLRAIESRRYRPVGSDVERAFDVRLVTATNRDLDQAVRAKGFRSDLLYRINVLSISIPPLRQREEDIALLAHHFLARAGSRAELTLEALTALEAYQWPGNVRELEHQMLRLVSTSLERIELRHLPRQIRAAARKRRPDRRRTHGQSAREQVEHALAATSGNITHAARVLGLTRHGLKKRMVRLGMRDVSKRATKGGRS